MTTTTTNLGLVLYNNTTDSSALFSAYRAAMSGNTGSSNMEKIDDAFDNIEVDTTLHNTRLGLDSLLANTTGTNNIAFGETALNAITTGYNNISIGNSSSYNSAVGVHGNIVIGTSSLQNATGNSNIVIGNGIGPTLGSNNVFIGNNANSYADVFFGSNFLGFDGIFSMTGTSFKMFGGGNSRETLAILNTDWNKPAFGIYGTDNPLHPQSALQTWYVGSGGGFGIYTKMLEVTNAGSLKFSSGANIETSSLTGSYIATDTTQKIGFWGKTPTSQPASSNQTALTNSTGGTYDGVISDVGSSFNQATLNNNFTELYTLLNAIRTALVDTGMIKGSV